MAAVETLLRARVKERVEDEFSAEGFEVADDKLPRAAGMDGETVLGCYPNETREMPGQANVLEASVTLQLYLAYTAEPDETIVVDPATIEGYAERLRAAFAGTDGVGGTGDFWYLRVTGIQFPDDPTGNRSRLEATIVAPCDNPAMTP